MKNTFVFIFVLLLFPLMVLGQKVEKNIIPMSEKHFLAKPFGHDEGIEDFTQYLPKGTRVQKLINRHPDASHRPDTIYNLIFKKSKISFYKTQFNQVYLLGGSVKNHQIGLANGVRVGMTKEDFFQSFTDIQPMDSDSITLRQGDQGRRMNFYFNKKGKLVRYTFSD